MLLCFATAAFAFSAPTRIFNSASIRSAAPDRSTSIQCFEEFKLRPSVTRSREVGTDRKGSILVTDGTDNLFASRTLLPMLNDFGRYKSIVAHSTDIVTAKKALLTREARYGGLLDVLGFAEGSLEEAFAGADSWLAVNADEAVLAASIDAAVAAGVTRVVVLLTGDGPTAGLADAGALEAKLQALEPLDYTVIRTGSLVDAEVGGGLKLADVDVPACEDVCKAEVFRFVTEALTLPEASCRLFSLCPSEGTVPTLKQLRLSGYERRDEYQLLLSAQLREPEAEVLPEDMSEEEKELVLRTEAELEAEREAELKALLAKARARGEATQARLAYEEKEKEAHRKEQEQYYKAPLPADDDAPPATGDADKGDTPKDDAK